MKNLVVLSGAGISAESGLKTFRDEDGLWEGHDVYEVASIDGFIKNPEIVLEFYNVRRRQLKQVQPNSAHTIIAGLESYFHVDIITQNVDDLHERAGSSNILHLHGELFKVRSIVDESLKYPWFEDLTISSKNEHNHKLRPDIVWFGEAVPLFDRAINIMEKADVVLIIGTSLQVYPAANLLSYAPAMANFYYIDINPAKTTHFNRNITIIKDTAIKGMESIYDTLIK